MITPEIDHGDFEDTDIKQLVETASQIAIVSAARIFDTTPQATYTVQLFEDESLGTFPVHLDHGVASSRTVISAHPNSMRQRYEEVREESRNPISFENFILIHIAGAAVPHILQGNVDPSNLKSILELDAKMADKEPLEDEIKALEQELGRPTTIILTEAVIGLSPEAFSRLNRLRLAVGSLIFANDDVVESRSPYRMSTGFGRQLVANAREELGLLPQREQAFVELSRKFGVSDDDASLQFRKSLSLNDLSTAFPMTMSDIASIAKHIG